MNYAQYLQQGGQTPSIEEQVASLVQAAMQGDQLANDQINQIMLAAEQGDQKAQQLALLIQQVTQKLQAEQPEVMKCGGKVRAKIKKACSGKKMEKGGEAPIKKEAKGGKPCPCTLHKVGGKLIEVDCNGIPIAKNGMVMKFQNPPQPLQMIGNNSYTADLLKAAGAVMDDKGRNTWIYLNPADNTYYRHPMPVLGNSVYGAWAKASDDEINRYHQLKGHIKTASGNWMIVGNDGLYTNTGYAGSRYGRSGNNFLSDLGATDATWNKDKNIWERDGFVYTKGKDNKYVWSPVNISELHKEETKSKYPGLFSGDLRSLQARQTWVKNNADYLRSQGWTDLELNGYKGQAALNLRLANQIARAEDWKKLQAQLARKAGEAVLQKANSYTKGPFETPNITVASQDALVRAFGGNDRITLLTPGKDDLNKVTSFESSKYGNYLNLK